MARFKRKTTIRIFVSLCFSTGFFSAFLLFMIFSKIEPVIIFWAATLAIFNFLFATWFFINKVRKRIKTVEITDDVQPKIVLIGGGTGLSSILKGIKSYSDYESENISAIVTVADDGGSTGKIRKELDIIAPGDIRNCIVALSREEDTMSKLFDFRFDSKGDLGGHSVGNLLLAALSIIHKGDFEKAVKTACKILAVKGKIIPACLSKVDIQANLEDGSEILGESKISKRDRNNKITGMKIIPENAKANPEALRAIKEADAIILGPGSLYTSVIPNLLFPGIKKAVKNSKALKIYVCNIMTQAGETDRFKASDHLKNLMDYLPGGVNYIIVNNGDMSYNLLEKYKEEMSFPVEIDTDIIKRMNVLPVMQDIISEGNYFRHDPDKLAGIILKLVKEYKNI